MVKKSSTVMGAKKRRPAVGGRPRQRAAAGNKAATSRPTARGSKARKTGPRHGKGRSRSVSSALTTTAQAISRTLGEAVTAFAQRMPWGAGKGDAIELLEADHRRLEELLNAGEKTTARAVKRRTQILKTITAALTAHEAVEETVLYPVLKSHAEAKAIVLEGYQEHHVADVVLKELHGLRASDERWGAKFKVFKENIEHHIEEEEGEMFKTARSVLSRAQLETLGERMRAMRAHTPDADS